MNLDDHHREGRAAASRRNRIGLGIDAEAPPFAAWPKGFSRIDPPALFRRLRETTSSKALRPWILLGVLAGGVLGITAASPWPLTLSVRHLLAARNCDTARLVGLAPAVRGAPGYWTWNDADQDGIACEPWPRWRQGKHQ